MKDVPEIAPEIRALIEEIVANPRSSLRLAPRRALLPWLEGGDTISARECSSETAARHLVAEHREAVARLLREAAHIAYWKKPMYSPRPVGPDGRVLDPTLREGTWREEAEGRVRASPRADDGVELLRMCLTGIDPRLGLMLARSSLMLARTVEGSIALAEHMKTAQPRSALRVFERVTLSGSPSLEGLGWAGVGGCLSYISRFEQSIEAYRRAVEGWPRAWLCVLNLACIGGRGEEVLEAGAEIGRSWPTDGPEIEEAVDEIKSWSRGLPPAQLSRAAETLSRLHDRLPETAWKIGRAYAQEH